MRDPLDRYKPGVSFWRITPQLADVNPFRKLRNDDPDPEKAYSSKVMWWIVRVYHLTYNNVLRDKLEEERQALVSEALFDDANWHRSKKMEKLLDVLKGGWDGLKTIAQRDLEMARYFHQQRQEYMSKLKYSDETERKEIQKEAPKTAQLLRDIAVLEDEVRKEMGEYEEEEDPDESALERGTILT